MATHDLQAKLPSFVTYMKTPSTIDEMLAGSSAFAHPAMQTFVSHFQSLVSVEDFNSTLRDLKPKIRDADSFHAALTAVLCGCLVEKGGDASILADVVVDRFMEQAILLHEYHTHHGTDDSVQQQYENGHEDVARAQASLENNTITAAAMAMLCRDVDARKRWREQYPGARILLNNLANAGKLSSTFGRLFNLVDDKDVTVVDQTSRRVFLTRLTGMQDVAYHYYALLQDALIQHVGEGYLEAEATDPKCVRYAMNDNLSPDDEAAAADWIDSTRFDFVYPGGYFIAGSMGISELPQHEGKSFLVIAKQGTTMSPKAGWGPENMYPIIHDALASKVIIVREMVGSEAGSWLKVLDVK